jgi:YD repeat-containing protein
MGADPRFGTAVPLVTKTVTTYPGHPSYPNQSSTETMGRAVERNAAGAVTKVTDSYAVSGVSGSSSLEWVASTRTLTLRTPDGRTLATELDALGRPWRVTRGTLTADVAQYTYDGRGRITSVTQGSSVLTADWSAADLPVRMVDAAGRETHLQWDAAARLVGFDGPGTAEWAFGYDAAGRRDRVTSPSGGVHQLGFDPSGQLVSYLAPGAPGPLGYTYDADGRRSSATLPDGRTQAYGRDGAGQITSITSADAAMEITQELTAGRTQPSLIRRTPAGGVAQDLAIEAAGPRVTATEMTGPAAARFSYTHDAAGLLAGITLTSGADTVTMSRASSPVGLVTNGPVSFSRSGPLGSANATSAAGMSGVFTYATTGRLAGRRFHVGGVTQFSETLTYDAGGG